MIHFVFDKISRTELVGWAFQDDPGDVVVRVRRGGQVALEERPCFPRPDVFHVFPARPQARWSGFVVDIAGLHGHLEIDVVGRDPTGADIHCIPVFRACSAPPALGSSASGSENEMSAPFPREVMQELEPLRPLTSRAMSWSRERQILAARSIVTAVEDAGLANLPATRRYMGYLGKLSHEFSRIEQNFPALNALVEDGAKDRHARANSADEILTIAHHLYCSKRDGILGDFAEFGCFKGFSTSMLSLACRALDLRMHVFDSFAGLPPSASTYYRVGDFTGALAEVERNVREFGNIDCVTFHEGFFADTVQALRDETFAALWVDVDLEISVRDAVGAFGRLAPEGALFSHECEAAYFDGWIWDARHPDRVIAPILDAYERHGEIASGAFLTGCTGGFWRQGRGKPILCNDALVRLLDLAKTV